MSSRDKEGPMKGNINGQPVVEYKMVPKPYGAPSANDIPLEYDDKINFEGLPISPEERSKYPGSDSFVGPMRKVKYKPE